MKTLDNALSEIKTRLNQAKKDLKSFEKNIKDFEKQKELNAEELFNLVSDIQSYEEKLKVLIERKQSYGIDYKNKLISNERARIRAKKYLISILESDIEKIKNSQKLQKVILNQYQISQLQKDFNIKLKNPNLYEVFCCLRRKLFFHGK